MFAFIIVFAPMFMSYAYTTGEGIVPKCNVGPVDDKGEYLNKCDFNYLLTLVNSVISFLLFYIASPIAAIIFVYAGFKLLTSGGSEEALTHAKKMMLTMVKGYVIALAAWLIIYTLVKELNFQGETFLQDYNK